MNDSISFRLISYWNHEPPFRLIPYWMRLYYDSSMWTMHNEFLGSFVVFGLALWILNFNSRKKELRVIILYFLLIIFMIVIYNNIWLLPFVAGITCAIYFPEIEKNNSLYKAFKFVLGGIGLYLLGHYQSCGAYLYFKNINYIYSNTVGSCLLIFSLYNLRLSGFKSKIAVVLGKISFPLYLIHVLIICSFSSSLYIYMISNNYPHYFILIILFTLLISVIISYPLILINDVWIKSLNKLIIKLVK
ncbi:acyltransferase family protein [Leptospirillum ferrooxidans]